MAAATASSSKRKEITHDDDDMMVIETPSYQRERENEEAARKIFYDEPAMSSIASVYFSKEKIIGHDVKEPFHKPSFYSNNIIIESSDFQESVLNGTPIRKQMDGLFITPRASKYWYALEPSGYISLVIQLCIPMAVGGIQTAHFEVARADYNVFPSPPPGLIISGTSSPPPPTPPPPPFLRDPSTWKIPDPSEVVVEQQLVVCDENLLAQFCMRVGRLRGDPQLYLLDSWLILSADLWRTLGEEEEEK